jgi:hypothetical protein
VGQCKRGARELANRKHVQAGDKHVQMGRWTVGGCSNVLGILICFLI